MVQESPPEAVPPETETETTPDVENPRRSVQLPRTVSDYRDLRNLLPVVEVVVGPSPDVRGRPTPTSVVTSGTWPGPRVRPVCRYDRRNSCESDKVGKSVAPRRVEDRVYSWLLTRRRDRCS